MTPDRGMLYIVLAVGLAAVGCTLGPGLWVWLTAGFRRRPPLLGPLFRHELLRLARGGLHPRLRALYAGVLLVGLLAAYLREFREMDPVALLGGGLQLPTDRTARFANTYFAVFTYCQTAAVTLLAPVFAAGAVTDERDRGTLDYLRASLLSNRELVVGKLTARLVFVGGVALTGLPVLTLTTLFGGVDPLVQAAVFAAAFAYALSLSAYSLWQATRCDSLRQTLFYVYFPLIAGSVCCCGPFISPLQFNIWALDWTSNKGIEWFVGYCGIFIGVHGTAATVFTVLAMGGVRAVGGRKAAPRPRRPRWEPALATALEPPKQSRWESEDIRPRYRERPPPRPVDVPRLREQDPFLWKERYFSARLPAAEGQTLRGVGWGLIGGYGLAGGFAVFAALVQAFERGGNPAAVLNPVVRIAVASAAAVLPLFAGLRTAGAVARERQRQTLDSLFNLPVDRVELLRPKWVAAVRGAKWWLVALAALGACGLVVRAATVPGLIASLGLVAGLLLFAASFGLWLSVRCGTTGRATVWLLVVLFALTVGPLILGPLTDSVARRWVGESSDWAGAVVRSLSGPVAGWQLGGDDPGPTVPAGLLAAAGYAMAAAGFWWAARRRFEAEGRV